jgi:hypothetical protein
MTIFKEIIQAYNTLGIGSHEGLYDDVFEIGKKHYFKLIHIITSIVFNGNSAKCFILQTSRVSV